MEHDKGDTILVTGGTGYTGSHLVRRLVNDGLKVRTFVRNPDKFPPLKDMNVEIATGDLRNKDDVNRAMEGVDVVYHIAALFRAENVTREDMFDINAGGAQNMLEAAEQQGVKRFVHCSTIGVHGDVKNPPATEESPFNPGDYYQESKLEGELIAQRFMKAGNIPISIYRPAGIYGPEEMRFLKLIKSIRNRSFVMIGSGEILYHMVYIDDLVDGIILCGTREEAVGEVFILAGEDNLTLNDLVALIAELQSVPSPKLRVPFAPVYAAGYAAEVVFKPLGIQPPIYRRRVDFFRKTRSFDISKAKNVLGYQPRVSLREGMSNTIAWYEKQGLL